MLDHLHDEPDPRRRRLIALGLLTRLLAPHGIEPILVGGGALELYTAGGYATKDMDLALPAGPEVDAAFAALGFEKEGRYWFLALRSGTREQGPRRSRGPGQDRTGGAIVLIGYDEFQRDVRRRKRERWAKILATEPPGHAPGRRPRDPEQERMLLRLDRARFASRPIPKGGR